MNNAQNIINGFIFNYTELKQESGFYAPGDIFQMCMCLLSLNTSLDILDCLFEYVLNDHIKNDPLCSYIIYNNKHKNGCYVVDVSFERIRIGVLNIRYGYNNEYQNNLNNVERFGQYYFKTENELTNFLIMFRLLYRGPNKLNFVKI